jgi:hypothetical protein
VLACVAALACLILAGCGSSSAPSAKSPQTGPESLFQAPGLLLADPAGALDRMKALGVDRVRVFLNWNTVAPAATAAARPPGFNPADPAAYPAGNWGIYDEIVRDAAARGIGLDLTLTGPAPQWATGRGGARGGPPGVWKPSAVQFGDFVHAVGTRYSGSYKPPGSSAALPRVDFWAIWNEPNYGVDLAPQAIDNSTVEVAPALYRRLLDAAWAALQQTGHGGDTIVIGETAPRGLTTGNNPGNFSGMVPLRFVRALYCVDNAYKRLTGQAAAMRSCPTSTGTAAFAAAHPALFRASGFADHPYPQGVPPNVGTPEEPDYADLPAIPKLERALDTVTAVYGSNKRFDIYDTEFGYQTNPPEKLLRAISPTLASYYLNWAEYLHYEDPRIRTYDQYLLVDPTGADGGNFATGLESPTGVPKATFYAYRMPLYLPHTTGSAGSPLVVWGAARPADIAGRQTGKPQQVELQFEAGSKGPFKTIRTITLTDPYAYYDVSQSFARSGILRASWRSPTGETMFSRDVAVIIH